MRNKPKPRSEFWTPERCYITELLNDVELPEVSLARARVAPGVTTELHAVSVAEWYVLEQGQGLMQVGNGVPFAVQNGDTVAVPKNTAQRVTNTGRDDLVFLCVCVPKFSQECYTSLE